MNDFNELMRLLDEIEKTAIEYNKQASVGASTYTAEISEIPADTKTIPNKIKKVKSKYTKERKQLADKVSQMARTANKRLDRLSKNNLEGQSAYAKWYQNGAVRFSVKGKSYQELQKEYWRVKDFLDSQTSTIKGAKENMQRVAEKVMGLKAEKVSEMSLQELNDATTNFFKISDAMEEYYEEINNNAKRLDYMKIFQEIKEYFDIEELILMKQDTDFDDLVKQMRDYLDSEQSLEQQLNLWE